MSTTPLNRWEKFMAKIAGQEVDIEPLNRTEQFYDEIAQKTDAALTPTITEPSDGDVIKYDATEGKWVNGEGGGSGGGVLVVNVTGSVVEGKTVMTCDKTAGEMAAALEAGGLILRFDTGDGAYDYTSITQAMVDPDGYTFVPAAAESSVFTAASASDYPSTGGSPK